MISKGGLGTVSAIIIEAEILKAQASSSTQNLIG
jgi:hypothetical protein